MLYAEDSLGLSVGVAGALPLGFGALTALGILVAGRARPERVHPLLAIGAALLGAGLLTAAPATSLPAAAVPFAVAALGAGLVTGLGFPYFARFVPEGEAGRYSGVFFAGRAVASAAALPLAGVAVELSGSYRAVLWFGAVALVALVPLGLARRRAERGSTLVPASLRPRPETVVAVIPVFASDRAVEVASAQPAPRRRGGAGGRRRPATRSPAPSTGSPATAACASCVATRTAARGAPSRPASRSCCRTRVRRRRSSCSTPTGNTIPSASPPSSRRSRRADVVIGNRRERRSMPLARRIANRSASLALLGATRTWVPDTQNGMRLFRTAALRDVALPEGGYEAESRHLRALLAAGRPVASVDIPTIYEGEPSHYRPLADSARVARALIASPGTDASPGTGEKRSPCFARGRRGSPP